MTFLPDLEGSRDSFFGKLRRVEWGMVFMIAMISVVGTILLFGAAGAQWEPWAGDHVIRFCFVTCLMLVVATVDVRFWYYFAYPAYIAVFVLLIGVELFGKVALGAQRWLEIGPIRIQPSEFMKIALILALARFYQDADSDRMWTLRAHLIPLLMLAAPAALITLQPDLGTAIMVAGVGATMVILAGLSWWYIAAAGAAVASFALIAFFGFMAEFQKNRILTFLDPSRDPLGTGYHITQSKIAIGSGGLFGVGYMQGTQSQLDFLPERHTDFVFAMLLEEFGMVGGVFVLGLYMAAMAYGISISIGCRHVFGKFLAAGVTMLMFIYVGINAGMIMGLMPVVGEPLPFLSYGGSVMLSLMFGIGLVQNARVYRDKSLGSGFKSSSRLR
ncbi:rod shape-determining protein RodA [Candidatus Phycosocius spiralis]|uniref:Peptidoglycan glycosyltransferase MrdB n=1 Tax=Candidatus Phycosocius spiralis TaxID=2815099 RepID=A0ABQ4PWX3_9PROT|nr:rod shape-determining protein RodA [Candidatus Phycosocius spiralis]GIU67574.1 rod shape-determining protein RodA [Candidatus Phycosocius spiralis]